MDEKLKPDAEIMKEIATYANPNYIWIEVWSLSPCEETVVVTVNKEELCCLGEFKVIYARAACLDDEQEIVKLKAYGKSLVQKIRRKFPEAKVRSRLYWF